jgi:hypothetical protein
MSTLTSRPTTLPRPDAPQLPLWRLTTMRAGYAFMAVGLALVKWPLVLDSPRSLPPYEGVVAVLLTAMSLLALLGLRYPVRLLPVLLFESLWKLIWLGAVALPAYRAHDVGPELAAIAVDCSLVVVVLAVVPWRYVWQRYVTAPGDPWRRA